jgi:hypothetical protein
MMERPPGGTETGPVDLDERVARIARQLGAMSGPLDLDEVAPIVALDRILAIPDPREVAAELYRLVLGRPPELGSGAGDSLAAGSSAVDLALDLVESDESVRRAQPGRADLVRELRLRSVRASWSLPPTGPLGRLLRDRYAPFVLAALRVTDSPESIGAALERLHAHGNRDAWLRAEWRSAIARQHGSPRSLRALASHIKHGPAGFRVFRSNVLALEPAAHGLLTTLVLYGEVGPDEAARHRASLAMAARVDEIAAGVRLLLQDHPW